MSKGSTYFLATVVPCKSNTSNDVIVKDKAINLISNYSQKLSVFADDFDISHMYNKPAMHFYYSDDFYELQDRLKSIDESAEEQNNEDNPIFKYLDTFDPNAPNPYANYSVFMIEMAADRFNQFWNVANANGFAGVNQPSSTYVDRSGIAHNTSGECLITQISLMNFAKGGTRLTNYALTRFLDKPLNNAEFWESYNRQHPDTFFSDHKKWKSGNGTGGYGDGM